MSALWQRSPATVRDVLEAVADDTDWAYSTVKTLLARLADKGAVAVRKRANTSLFEPLVSRDEARRSALRSLLDRAFDGTFGALVHHLVADEELGGDEAAELRAMLARASRGKRKRTR